MDAKNAPEWSDKKGITLPPVWTRKAIDDVGVKEAVTDHAQALFSASVDLYTNLPYKLHARYQTYQESFESEIIGGKDKVKVHDLIRDESILRALKKSQLEFQPAQIRIDLDGDLAFEKPDLERSKSEEKLALDKAHNPVYLTFGFIGVQKARDVMYFRECETIRYSVHLTHEEQMILHTYFELLAVQTRRYLGGPYSHAHVNRIIREICRHIELSSTFMVVGYNIHNKVHTMYLKKTSHNQDWSCYRLVDPGYFAEEVIETTTCIERKSVPAPQLRPLEHATISTAKIPIYIQSTKATRFARNV